MTKIAVRFLLGQVTPHFKALISLPVNGKKDRTYLIGILSKLSELMKVRHMGQCGV